MLLKSKFREHDTAGNSFVASKLTKPNIWEKPEKSAPHDVELEHVSVIDDIICP